EQGPDALGSMNLVCGHRVQIDAELFDIDRNLSRRLHTVGMEIDIRLGGNLADFGDWLDRSDFIVRVHDRDENRVPPDSPSNIVRINQTLTRYGQPRNFDSLFLEIFASM